MKRRLHKIYLALVTLVLLMMPQGAWATTAYVSTYAELSAAISNASVDVIIVTANIDVPCENSGNAGNTDLTGASTAQLIIRRSLTLQSQAGSKYIIKRVAANGADATKLKSLIAIRGDGQGNSGTANLTQNTMEVSFTNIIIDGGAVWGSSTVCERRNGAANAYGNAGRSIIDVYLGGVLNLEDGVEIKNGYTTKSDNSLLNDSGTSACFGGAVRVDYHNQTGGGTVNIKAGATVHDCATRGGYGGALGAYNYARLNLYGGTISDCSADNGGAIACTYRSATGYGSTSAGTIRMYGGVISNCCATNGGAFLMHGNEIDDYFLGGSINSCSATSGGAMYVGESNSTPNVHMVAPGSGLLTITGCTNTNATNSANTGGYDYVYLNKGTISEATVYQVTFRNNNTDFAILHVLQNTSLGEAFPAAPVNASFRFVGWYNGDTQVTSSTVINDNITVTAKWDFLGSGTEEEPYSIPSAEAWNFLADQVNGGTNYSGKYFQQTGDFTVSSKIIGYPTDDTHYVTFNGIYDGNGRTITASISKSGERYVAPFHCIADATIKNVIVTGSVTVSGGASIERRRHPAGLVGVTDGTCILQNCRVSANVSGCDYMGGLIGHTQNANITITGCVYSGTLTASDSNNTGGLIGWGGDNGGKTYALSNNLFAGSYSGSGKFHPVGFLYNPTGNTRTVTNTYYMTGLQKVSDDDGNSLVKGLANKGKFAYSITGGTGVTVSNAGTPTTYYNVSDITSYGIGIKYGEVLYGGNGDAVSLNLTATNHTGYSVYDYSTNNGTLTGSSNPYTLTMAAANSTINVRYSAAISIAATTTNAKNGWYLIASPIGTVSPTSVTNLLSNDYDLYRFNQSAEMEWQNYKVHNNASENPFNALISGQGYLYANSSKVDLTFIGTPYSGTGVVSLSYSETNPDTRMRGWNLIGNPFGVTATINKEFYRMNGATHAELIVANDNNVAPMEGVFVQATAENQSVTFSTGAKRETTGSEDCIVINLSDNKGTIIDRAIVSFEKGHTLPKFQIKDNSTKLYIPQNGMDYAIAFSYRIGELPLNFKANETGQYTLNFNGNNMTGVSLVDMIDNVVIDLNVNDTYTFIGTPTDREDRFKLVFSSPNDSNIDIFAYQSGNEIVVSGEGELQVFDVMGRMVVNQYINGVQTVEKPSITGVYILRLNEKSQKIVVR